MVQRGELPESWHFGAGAVVTPEGRLVSRLGDPRGVRTYLRSSAKPFQALPLVQALESEEPGASDGLVLDDADLALICASHSGGPEHVERAASLLERGGFGPEDLRCGTHRPLGRRENAALRDSGVEPGPLHNNCSGKHAGMLLACRLLGYPPDSYPEPEHPLQRRIATEMARFTRLRDDELGRGVDGCSVPTFHLSLTAAARAWAALAAPEPAGLPDDVCRAANRLRNAMGRAPEMVAGPGRFTTRLAQVTGGRVVGKEGAEGIYTLAVRGPVALGIAFKIADGSDRARDGVAMEVLRQVGSLSGEEFDELREFYRPEVRNHRDLLVGRIVPDFELEEA